MAYAPASSLNVSTTANTTLRDSQTASQLFVSDQFRLAPKYNFQFHVAFVINSAALQNKALNQRHASEINMMVKTCDLPSFDVKTETLNQYNRKKVVQVTHNYSPINITFHDDNMGVINQMWQNYYNYYYADPSSAKDPGAYARTAMKNFNYIHDTYGLDNGATNPFFTNIIIYQIARHEYVSYKLYNPVIVKWNHNKLNYFESTTHDNSVEIAYEAVSYGSGTVTSGDPIGFAESHYDLTPSPITGSPGLSTSPTFTSSTTANNLAFYNNANTTVNTYQNTISPLPTGALTGIVQDLTSSTSQGVSGLSGVVFPTTQTTTSINASLLNLNI